MTAAYRQTHSTSELTMVDGDDRQTHSTSELTMVDGDDSSLQADSQHK